MAEDRAQARQGTPHAIATFHAHHPVTGAYVVYEPGDVVPADVAARVSLAVVEYDGNAS